MQIKATNRTLYKLEWLLSKKKYQVLLRVQTKGKLAHGWWECILVQYGKQYGGSLKN